MPSTTYPARIEEVEPGEFLVTFRDVPEALTSADSFEAAAELARGALSAAIEGYIHAGRSAPQPRPADPNEIEIALLPPSPLPAA